MAEMAIVAIPDDRDPVWKISSEKVPHMTLLYLGDQNPDERVPHIAEYLEHATKSSLTRFGMSVDRRGELGPEDADVLFFDKNWTARQLADFRANLLKDPVIFGMYNSVEQYPEWTPHLTLGYPETPAKELKDGPNASYWVEFNKVAFWFDDFEGVEYLIPADENYVDSVAWADQNLSDFLAHYGVKGMKWGVSRTRSQIDADSQDVSKVKANKAKIKTNRTTDVLTNKELQEVVTRMNLEQQYKRLSTSNKKELFRGENFIKDAIKTGKTVNDALNTYSSVRNNIGPLMDVAIKK